MLTHHRALDHEDEGFTLIELMVVVLIMGILMAIAIPTFLSTQGSANDASAKSNAVNALTGEKAYYEDNQVFLDTGLAANAQVLDPNLPWTDATGAATTAKVTAQAGLYATSSPYTFTQVNDTTVTTGSGLLVEDLSKSGHCFYIADNLAMTPPVLAFAESVGCFTDANIAMPASNPTVSSGNAGANIVPSATGALAAANWYASW
jgi:type IV pilus assembly protein PilA